MMFESSAPYLNDSFHACARREIMRRANRAEEDASAERKPSGKHRLAGSLPYIAMQFWKMLRYAEIYCILFCFVGLKRFKGSFKGFLGLKFRILLPNKTTFASLFVAPIVVVSQKSC